MIHDLVLLGAGVLVLYCLYRELERLLGAENPHADVDALAERKADEWKRDAA